MGPFNSRFMSQNSAVAFPRSLGVDFQSTNPPRLHSFAYNLGVRPEENGGSYDSLTNLLSENDFKKFSAIYFSAVNSVFSIWMRTSLCTDVKAPGTTFHEISCLKL
jgi:hypothetical protein